MLLDHLQDRPAAERLADSALGLMRELFPICRSITGQGVRQSLDILGRHIALQRSEVPTGTPVLDWEVPREWNIRDAWVSGPDGRRLIDFRAHTLHVMSYSVPVRARMSRQELEPHLHSLPEQPDLIPYRTSYYRDNWGFCLRHRDRLALGEGPFDVVIDSDLQPGHLSYAEHVVPGQTPMEALVHTHICHPSLANDNLSGMALATLLAQAMAGSQPRLTWRFIFSPGTIGSLTWLSRNEARLPRVKAGLVVGLLGDAGGLTYKRSRRGRAPVDRIAELLLPAHGGRCVDFEPYGYDERQFCSPGFDLGVGRLTRSANGGYPQYHTSGDNLDLIQPASLAGSVQALSAFIGAIDTNRRWRNLAPKGEPRLGKRGLYGGTGGGSPAQFEHGLLWLLSQCDGGPDLVAVAQRSGMPLSVLDGCAKALEAAGLLAEVDEGIEALSSQEPR